MLEGRLSGVHRKSVLQNFFHGREILTYHGHFNLARRAGIGFKMVDQIRACANIDNSS
jgi:hypothetical protein